MHTPSATKLPLEFQDISCAWLSEALAQRYPGVEVTAFERDGEMHSTSSKARLRLTYNEAGQRAGLPASMYIKGGFNRRVLKRVWGALAIEVRFFMEVAPELNVNIPRCYFAQIDEQSRQGIVLLEDLTARGVSFGVLTEPLTPDRVATMLELMARYHGHWWNDPRLSRYADFKVPMHLYMKWQLRRDWWERMLEMPQAAHLPAELRDADLMERAVDTLWELNERMPQTYVHGDPHLGNTYFEKDLSPGLLDWQCSMRGPWAHDVSYFIAGVLDVEDRRSHERDLLKHYLAALRAAGGEPPDFDSAWLEHRRQMMHGLPMFTPTDPNQGPEAWTVAASHRFQIAAADLDVLESLGLKRSR
ncbi:MAG: phosphotransferase [Sulfuricaulis sp.]|nr:phosphotransferase [Sulfuricaulis sp.]